MILNIGASEFAPIWIRSFIIWLAGPTPQTGWGLKEETFYTLSAMQKMDGESWFRIGDTDLATHLLRSELLRKGLRLSEVVQIMAERFGVKQRVLPMSDLPCPTMVLSDEGEMGFQTYFVKRACEPQVLSFRWKNDKEAVPTPEALQALEQADLVIFSPSNPFVSLDPILNRPGMRSLIEKKNRPGRQPDHWRKSY